MQHLERIAAAQMLINKTAELVHQSIDQEQDAIRRKNAAHQKAIENSHHFASDLHRGVAVGSAALAGLGLIFGAKGFDEAMKFCGNLQQFPQTAAQPFISTNQAHQTMHQEAQRTAQLEQKNVERDEEALERIRNAAEQQSQQFISELGRIARAMMNG